MNTAKMQYNINLLLDPLEQEFLETKTSQPRVLRDFRLGPSQKGPLKGPRDRWSKSGMHNIRPAGQMWPAKAFNLALKALAYVHLA